MHRRRWKVRLTQANSIEELEAVATSDVLNRGGITVTFVSVEKTKEVKAANKAKLVADLLIDEVYDEYDVIVLPGGMPGAEHLRDSKPLKDLLTKQKAAGKLIAAICASPAVVLQSHGLLDGIKATSYPSFQSKLSVPVDEKVVVDQQMITSQGPGTAIQFALRIVEVLMGSEKSKAVQTAMLA
ncbi:MAG: uncharacterized protein KVP18_004151 [Porospora cf. gigantea A]|uniref:uncharacterized protein n=1 Tax=Porospora cf. gigantea A TaxID=2853593 RepID=UPI00355A31E3|nr:MAG: hypothetical protein KVP18_004151 [Porospora cf. gigantea A]